MMFIKILTEYENRDNFCFYGELGDILQFILGGSSSIQVARDEDLAFQIGKEIHFDLVDHDKVRSFRIQKQTLFSQFKVRNWLQLPILCLFEDTCKLLFLSHHLHHSCLFYHSQVQDFFLPLEEGLSSLYSGLFVSSSCQVFSWPSWCILTGRCCKGTWHPSGLSEVLVMGKATESHLPTKQTTESVWRGSNCMKQLVPETQPFAYKVVPVMFFEKQRIFSFSQFEDLSFYG